MRLDVYLHKNGLAKSRTRAAELISGGFVLVGGTVAQKPSLDVDENSDVRVIGEDHSFVGRGGLKLDGALEQFNIDVSGFVCADVGASTGGFTDCLLKRGASRVYAIDSGHDQLDKRLLKDSRVVNIEGCNARFLTSDTLGEKCDAAVCDLSFISQTLVLGAVSDILKDGGILVSLIKPQFECGREALSKGGIVKDKKYHKEAVKKVLSCAAAVGLSPVGLIKSPILGGDGNTEFLFYAIRGAASAVNDNIITEVVNE